MIAWFTRIRQFIGIFWTKCFNDIDFLYLVENLLTLIGLTLNGRQLDWMHGITVSTSTYEHMQLPYPIYLDRADISKAPVDISDILDTENSRVFGDVQDDLWVATSTTIIAAPDWISDHPYSGKFTAIRGLDYTFNSKAQLFIFKTDPDKLGLSTIRKTSSDGVLHTYYKLFGFIRPDYIYNDAVSGFYYPELHRSAETVWDMHVNGSSMHSIKKLLAQSCDTVISDTAGIVTESDTWSEYGLDCMRVGDRLYTHKRADARPTGPSAFRLDHYPYSVAIGDVLFGSMRVYDSTQTPDAAEVPGIYVRTDVGDLMALNQDMPAYLPEHIDPDTVARDSTYILPLTGDATIIEDYKVLCTGHLLDSNIPYIPVPETVNPYRFVINTLRRKRSAVILLEASKLSEIEPVLEVLRRNTVANAIITVFIRAIGEPVTAPVAGFNSDVCMAAVAEYGTIGIMDAGSEVNRLI